MNTNFANFWFLTCQGFICVNSCRFVVNGTCFSRGAPYFKGAAALAWVPESDEISTGMD